MNRSSTIALILLLIGGLFLSSRLNHQLVDVRRELGITQADPEINAPPLVVFTTVALGGFRGIIADILWMRSARLQYEGKFFELVQLADWITKLEPRFTDVWAYHAWNLAYNISVLFPDPADRWRWVRHGISLLRDEGLVYNPGDARLMFELGWFFQHKMGGDTDDAHMHYKKAWAEEMQVALDGPRPDYLALAGNEAQRMRLVRDYGLDPSIMQDIEKQYGPLDWRLPQAHAIYWASQSRRNAKNKTDIVFAERMIYQSMTDAFRRGRLYTGTDGTGFLPAPFLELRPYVLRAYEQALANPDEPGTAITGYRYFLSETVVLLYLYNRTAEAREVLATLRRVQPDIPDSVTLEEFVFQTYTSRGMNMTRDEAYASIESALYQAITWRRQGDPERAAGFDQLARLIWNRYMAPRQDNPDLAARTGLPRIEEIRAQALQRMTEEAAE